MNKSDVDKMVYIDYVAKDKRDGKVVSQGRVCPFEKDARDRLFKDAGLVEGVSEQVSNSVGCAYVFDPPVTITPDMILEFS